MELSEIFVYALRELDGFDEEYIAKAKELAKNDIVETDEEFIDFINFNIEDKKFPYITQPYEEKTIRKAIEKARKYEGRIIHHVGVLDYGYPKKILQAHLGDNAPISYKGNVKQLEQKTIMITGSMSATKNAKLASKYFGKLFASKGYNILTTLAEGCERDAIRGCQEAKGNSTIFLPHNIEFLSFKEKGVVQDELEAGRCVLMAVSNAPKQLEEDSIDDSYRYLIALADCLIVTQISIMDNIMRLVQKFLSTNKPVFLIKYRDELGFEYDCIPFLESLGAKFISSDTALSKIKDAIGVAQDSD